MRKVRLPTGARLLNAISLAIDGLPCELTRLRTGGVYWLACADAAHADLFAAGAEGYFLACRLAETLHPTLPDAVDRRGLDNQRQALFGHPMSGGGLMEELLDITEELIFLSQDAIPCDLR